MAQNTSRSFIHIYLHRPATIHTSTQCDALILQKYTLQHRYIYFFLAFPRIFNSPATTACRNILIQGFLVKALRMVRKTSVQYSREHIAEVCVCVCVYVYVCILLSSAAVLYQNLQRRYLKALLSREEVQSACLHGQFARQRSVSGNCISS